MTQHSKTPGCSHKVWDAEVVLRRIHEREISIMAGFRNYLLETLSDYLDKGKVMAFADMLFKIKRRPADTSSIEQMCMTVSDQRRIRSISEPNRILEPKNLYALMYNMIGFLNITRNEAGVILKSCFPEVFSNASVLSINKSLTRHKMDGTRQSQKIQFLESSDADVFEEMMRRYSGYDT